VRQRACLFQLSFINHPGRSRTKGLWRKTTSLVSFCLASCTFDKCAACEESDVCRSCLASLPPLDFNCTPDWKTSEFAASRLLPALVVLPDEISATFGFRGTAGVLLASRFDWSSIASDMLRWWRFPFKQSPGSEINRAWRSYVTLLRRRFWNMIVSARTNTYSVRSLIVVIRKAFCEHFPFIGFNAITRGPDLITVGSWPI